MPDDKYEIDYEDSKKMWKFQMDTLRVADDYATARREFAKSLKVLKLALARAYKDQRIERKISEEKAYLILADNNEECKIALQNLIFYEGEYKGLEQVLQARQGTLSFNQSLIKNNPKVT